MTDDIADLSIEQLKREMLSLKRENQAAMATIAKLLKDINKKNEEIGSLQNLLSSTVPVVQTPKDLTKSENTPEGEIADLQLERLRQAAKARTLTLEETRMFDLLVKNKRLAQDKSTENFSKGSFRDVTELELVKIATMPKQKPYGSDPK